MIRAVIFDMDGLMVDTERLHHESFAAVLEQYGVRPVPNEQGVIHTSGVSAETNWERLKQQYGFEAVEQAKERDSRCVASQRSCRDAGTFAALANDTYS